MLNKCAIVILSSIVLSSCASMTRGNEETVKVHTPTRAVCTLRNDKGVWRVNAPGTVLINRSNDDLQVSCGQRGFVTKTAYISSKTNSIIYGNSIMPGGLIGTAIDMGDGAAYDYPRTINVPLHTK